jgi:drug/metabolite transporter (DMT)-like permease
MSRRDAVDLGLLGAVWGAAFLFMRVAAPEFGPVALIFVRVTIAAVLLGAVVVQRGNLSDLRSHTAPLVVLGAMNTAVPFTLFAFAALTLPAGLNSVLNATVPLFGAVVALVWLGERLPPARAVGLVVGFSGVLALAWPKLAVTGDRLAVVAPLVATLLYAGSAHYTRRTLNGVASMVVAGGSQVAAALLMAPLAVAFWPAVQPTATAWASAVALGVLCTAVAYALYFRLLARTGPVTTLTVTYLIPVFGVTWGAIFLHERLPGSALLGGLLVLAGVALTSGLAGREAVRSFVTPTARSGVDTRRGASRPVDGSDASSSRP